MKLNVWLDTDFPESRFLMSRRLALSVDDRRVLCFHESMIKQVESQFSSGPPFSSPEVHLPDNHNMALKRLVCMECQKIPSCQKQIM